MQNLYWIDCMVPSHASSLHPEGSLKAKLPCQADCKTPLAHPWGGSKASLGPNPLPSSQIPFNTWLTFSTEIYCMLLFVHFARPFPGWLSFHQSLLLASLADFILNMTHLQSTTWERWISKGKFSNLPKQAQQQYRPWRQLNMTWKSMSYSIHNWVNCLNWGLSQFKFRFCRRLSTQIGASACAWVRSPKLLSWYWYCHSLHWVLLSEI